MKVSPEDDNREGDAIVSRMDSRSGLATLVGERLAIGSAAYSAFSSLLEQHSERLQAWFELWRLHTARFLDLESADENLPRVHGFDRPGGALFAAQAYCAVVADLASERLSPQFDAEPPPQDGLLALPFEIREAATSNIAKWLAADLPHLDNPLDFAAFLSQLHQRLLPPTTRHHGGEYHTPLWLAARCIDELPASEPGDTCLDPSCGSGIFLVLWATRSSHAPKLVGVDVNPLALHLSRLCLQHLASRSELTHGKHVDYDLHLADYVCDPTANRDLFARDAVIELFAARFPVEGNVSADDEAALGVAHSLSDDGEFIPHAKAAILAALRGARKVRGGLQANTIIGNPPWISWDGLAEHYRRMLANEWSMSPLASNKGWLARVSAGKTDMSSLFVYRSVDRHATANAQMSFVLPLSLFQSRRAAEGFREFRTKNGRSYALSTLHDFSAMQPFGDASNRTSLATFAVDSVPKYPVSAYRWKYVDQTLKATAEHCRPILADTPTSPLAFFSSEESWIFGCTGPSDYRARGGVNTGGANGLLWLEVDSDANGVRRVRNVGKTRRGAELQYEGLCEDEVVYRLVRGTDIDRWSCQPQGHIALFYNPDSPKKAIDEERSRVRFPHAYAFVSQFREKLRARKEYHRWGGTAPFYEVYRIGPYTFSRHKVVWRHMGFRDRLRAAVACGDAGQKAWIPDQKVILVAAESADEAHYICAFLNSAWVGRILQKYLALDVSTHILDFIPLPSFSKTDSRHVELSRLSRSAHSATAKSQGVSSIEERIDEIVGTIVRAIPNSSQAPPSSFASSTHD